MPLATSSDELHADSFPAIVGRLKYGRSLGEGGFNQGNPLEERQETIDPWLLWELRPIGRPAEAGVAT